MDRSIDIEFAIAEVLASDGLLLINDLPAERGQIRAKDRNVLIRGHAIGKHHIQTTAAVIVDTSVDGGIGKPCRIEARGDVIITGSASNLHITARSIHLGGQTRYCHLESLRNTVVEGDLIETRIVLGNLGSSKTQISQFDAYLRNMIEQRETLNRQIDRDANHLHKTCKSASFNLNLAVGRMIQHDAHGLKIDLGFFYEKISKTKEEEIQAALSEFFNRGIIGVLGRTNRTYFATSPANERLFIKTLADLRQLVLLVRQRDVLAESIEGELAKASTLIDHLEDPRRHLCVHGSISPGSSVHFAQPQIKIAPNGSIGIENTQISLRIRADGDEIELHQTRPNGQQSTTRTMAEDLAGLYIRLNENAAGADEMPAIRLQPLASATESPIPTSNLQQTSILVVSDSPFIADLAIDELKQRGFNQVTVAANGYLALDALRDHSADIAFFDLGAPGVDGDAFLKVVRASQNGADLAIALLARKDREQEAIAALENGADEYLLKPLSTESLVLSIGRLTNLRSLKR